MASDFSDLCLSVQSVSLSGNTYYTVSCATKIVDYKKNTSKVLIIYTYIVIP